jgi:hypothetical protein
MDAHANVAFGEELTFVGYDLESPEQTPGAEVPLTLYFQVNEPTANAIQGRVEFAAPWWQFWNPARSSVPFALDLQNRKQGDIVQARVQARVPAEASAGSYDLRLTLDALTRQSSMPTNSYTFANLNIDSLARSSDLPPIAHPMAARFGDAVEFLGYELDAPDPLTPRSRLRLTLYWRALKAMDTSYKVFAHLIDTHKTIHGQRDQIPLDGARPTTGWAPGEILTDVYEFEVAPDAPPGAYQLEIGFYNEGDFTRLPVTDANGRALGDHLVFEELRVQ